MQTARNTLSIALTIAGSDSGGGAGIQADLKTFAALGVHGTSAITCLTAQNPSKVLGIEVCSPKILRQQIEAVFAELPPQAVKAGMLYSAENISVIADFFRRQVHSTKSPGRGKMPKTPPLIVDPILISTSGTRLLESSALRVFCEKLLPLATLVTPNVPEAEILTGETIASIEEMMAAAQKIHARFGCAVLIKGGHLPTAQSQARGPRSKVSISTQTSHDGYATDVFFDGQNEFLLSAPFVKNLRTHGTGCTYSAAICATVAIGNNLPEAVHIGKKFVTDAITHSCRIGNHFVLNHFPAE